MGSASGNAIDIERVINQTSLSHVHYLPETNSTNDVALARAELLDPGDSELILTSNQTRGRGRGENRWWSSDGALTFSLITPVLPIPVKQSPIVSLAAGVAICQGVERLAPQGAPRLKWPNDVFLNARKVAGILIEVPRQSPGRFVIGVGLNVNNSLENAPAEVQALATSLADAASRRFDLSEVLVECLQQLEQALAMLVAGDPLLPQLWRAYSLLVGREVRVVNPGGFIQGVCQTIAEDGALVLKTPQGEISCYGGVVEWFG